MNRNFLGILNLDFYIKQREKIELRGEIALQAFIL